MTAIDTMQIEKTCDLIKDYLIRCRRKHTKIDPKFLLRKGQDIMDWAYQSYCFSKGKIPVSGVYEF